MLNALVIGPKDAVLAECLEKIAWVPELHVCHHSVYYPSPAELLGLLDVHKPNVVLISLVDYDRAQRAINRITSAKPIPIVALNTRCEQQLLLDLMQLGVRELWFPPFDVEQMKQTVSRLVQQKAANPAILGNAGALVALLPARGGCGATTIAMHTAAALQEIGGPVLLADFDFHNSTIAFWMKVTPLHGLQEALERSHWLDESLWRSMVSRIGDLEVLTAPQASTAAGFSGTEAAAVIEFARTNYRFVLVDLPEAIYSSCWEVLEQAARILIVLTPEMSSLYLARRKISQIVDRGIARERIRIVLNRSTPNDLQPSEVEKFLAVGVAAHIGNHYRAVTAAFADGKLVAPDSKLGAQYRHLAEQLADRVEKKEEKAGSWKISRIFSPA